MITSKKLLKHKNIKHGFFNRNGGKSKGIYKSLNCGHGSNDDSSKILQNLSEHQQNLTEICKISEIRTVQKNANLVDLEKCRKMRLCSIS